MDRDSADPWANAWGDPSASHIPWSHKTNNTQDPDADIATPSWVPGAGIPWAEPSEDQATLWQATSPKEWATSSYEDIKLGNTSSDKIAAHSFLREQEIVDADTDPTSASNHLARPITEADSQNASPALASPALPETASPDAFGTFEIGLGVGEPTVDPWSESAIATTIESTENIDAWTSSWGTSDMAGDKEPNQQVDEWETAKRLKEKQGRHVPPHVLSLILREFQAFSSELWPQNELTSTSDDSYLDNRHGGIDGVEGLTSVTDRIVPQELTLPGHVPFSKTFTAKHMMEALRSSRNVAVPRTSPFALYMASKGSTAWETSVKSQPEVNKDDLLPLGWRVVEKEKEEPISVVEKKTGGGLLSFFGRRGTPSSAMEVTRSSSSSHTPSLSTTSAASPAQIKSARSSLDFAKPPLTPLPPRPTTSTQTSFPSALEGPSQASFMSSPRIDGLDPPVQAQSAVSRFLTRFSRSEPPGLSAHDPLALSTDDIEFLSDTVPSANDDADEASQLEEMCGSSALATKLPPPLPPPPRLTIPAISSNNRPSLSQPISAVPGNDKDFMSLFDSPSLAATPRPSSTSFTPRTPSYLGPFSPATPTAPKIEPQSTGSSSSSRRGSSMSFDPQPSLSRAHTPNGARRTPMAIMSSDSQSISTLPPPILPPPPSYRSSNSEFTSTSQPPSRPSSGFPASENRLVDDDHFSDSYSSPPPPPPRLLQQRPRATSSVLSMSSDFSDTSLLFASLQLAVGDKGSLDDLDGFVSSSLAGPSPPPPPAKPVLFGHKPLPQPLLKDPLYDMSQAAGHQQSISFVTGPATHPARRSLPPPPLPETLTPPPRASQPTLGVNLVDGPAMPKQRMYLMATLKPSLSSTVAVPAQAGIRPAHFTATSGSTYVSPQRILNGNGMLRPASKLATAAARPNTPPVRGLSAQDLSFFEGS